MSLWFFAKQSSKLEIFFIFCTKEILVFIVILQKNPIQIGITSNKNPIRGNVTEVEVVAKITEVPIVFINVDNTI